MAGRGGAGGGARRWAFRRAPLHFGGRKIARAARGKRKALTVPVSVRGSLARARDKALAVWEEKLGAENERTSGPKRGMGPSGRIRRKIVWTQGFDALFLEGLAICGNVQLVARKMGVAPATLYRRRCRDWRFKLKWEKAMEQQVDDLRGALCERLTNGWAEPVWYQGKAVGTKMRYDHPSGVRLLHELVAEDRIRRAEAAAEAELVASRAASLRADVLVVPHHGSRGASSRAFVAAVRPRHALVSTGYGNRFHFPAREVLARYRALGASVHDTAQTGAITVRMGAEGRTEIRHHRVEHRRFWHTPLATP